MDLEAILQFVTPEVHAALQRAVETGRWADGVELSREQRELCMQAVIAFEARELPPEQRTGYIDRGSKTTTDRCAHPADDEPAVIRIVQERSG